MHRQTNGINSLDIHLESTESWTMNKKIKQLSKPRRKLSWNIVWFVNLLWLCPLHEQNQLDYGCKHNFPTMRTMLKLQQLEPSIKLADFPTMAKQQSRWFVPKLPTNQWWLLLLAVLLSTNVIVNQEFLEKELKKKIKKN